MGGNNYRAWRYDRRRWDYRGDSIDGEAIALIIFVAIVALMCLLFKTVELVVKFSESSKKKPVNSCRIEKSSKQIVVIQK